jgi:hypothetical protein
MKMNDFKEAILQPNFPLNPTFKNHDKSAKTAQEVDEILHN